MKTRWTILNQTVNGIVEWLRKQVRTANMQGLLVGVSGGLDSAVVAYLIEKAFPNHSLGVIMPLKSNPVDLKHANQVIEKSKIDGMTVDLSETHDMLLSTIKQHLEEKDAFNPSTLQLADANLRARLRMSTLYTLATNYNYLVVGTDNKSEWYTGYFTKFGDGGVDLLPIVDFTKSEVYEMGEYLGIPQEVLQKKPSADLWKGQTDEEEMGTTYDKIDAYIRGERVPEKDEQLIEQMHQRTAHKRQLPKMLLKSELSHL